jgi:hypothetical protein
VDRIEDRWAQQNQEMRNDILKRIVPDVVELWAKKNQDYAGQQMFLGLKAQFCDINRKFWKLKAALWDGKPMEFEDPIEVCKDMIGHLLMTIYFLEQDRPTVETPSFAPMVERCPAMLQGGHDYMALKDGRTMCKQCHKVLHNG